MSTIPKTVDNSDNYDARLRAVLKAGIAEWFKGLSKEDLLQFLADRPAITADVLRDMMANYNLTVGFGTVFNTKNEEALAVFEKQE